MRLYRKHSLAKLSKYCLTLISYSTLKSIIWDSCRLYFYVGNLTQNVKNGKLINVNNELNVRNVRN